MGNHGYFIRIYKTRVLYGFVSQFRQKKKKKKKEDNGSTLRVLSQLIIIRISSE